VFPCEVDLGDGNVVTVEAEHVKPNQKTIKETGEWYLPHVIEPAFGIDRIIWHVLDHAYHEDVKNDERYTRMQIAASVAPVDVAVFPLFEKDGMGDKAWEVHRTLCGMSGVVSMYDASGSIGRRYARADEIGVPRCITVDHQTLVDNTVTIRNRDTGEQDRVIVNEALDLLRNR